MYLWFCCVQDLALLLGGTKANIVLNAMKLIEYIRLLPPDKAAMQNQASLDAMTFARMADEKVGLNILMSTPFMEAWISFTIQHASASPETDFEFLGVKGCKLLKRFVYAVEEGAWQPGSLGRR